MRSGTLLGLALAIAVAAGGLWTLVSGAGRTSADIVNGEYSMEMAASSTNVNVGDTFTITVGVFHDNSVGTYGAAQWSVGYDNTIVAHGFGGACLRRRAGRRSVLLALGQRVPHAARLH